jgi:hypothetical protein
MSCNKYTYNRKILETFAPTTLLPKQQKGQQYAAPTESRRLYGNNQSNIENKGCSSFRVLVAACLVAFFRW